MDEYVVDGDAADGFDHVGVVGPRDDGNAEARLMKAGCASTWSAVTKGSELAGLGTVALARCVPHPHRSPTSVVGLVDGTGWNGKRNVNRSGVSGPTSRR
jgi:hypothetical protein